MKRIKKIISEIKKLDSKLMEKAQIRLDNLTKPQGSLGRLEDIAKLVVGITGQENPAVKKKVIFTFAADHGVTEEGVSAFPKEVTAQMVYNFLDNGAGINVLAGHVGARVVVADLGVASDLRFHKNLLVSKINYGTKNLAKGPAMKKEEAIASVCAGIDIFMQEYKKGIDIIGIGEMGIGNTTASSAIAAVFTKKSIGELVGSGTGVNKQGLRKKINVIKKALQVNKPNHLDVIDVLAKVGGFEIGGLAGVIIAAASKRVPIVIDGFISSAAALIAYKIAPIVKDYMISSHVSVEKGHKVILEHIGITPIFDLNLRLGEGTGAALGINLVEASIKILTQMATFKSANVSKKLENE